MDLRRQNDVSASVRSLLFLCVCVCVCVCACVCVCMYMYVFIEHSIPKSDEYTFFSSAHGTYSKNDHMLGHKASLSKFKKIKIIPSAPSLAPVCHGYGRGVAARRLEAGRALCLWRCSVCSLPLALPSAECPPAGLHLPGLFLFPTGPSSEVSRRKHACTPVMTRRAIQASPVLTL